MKYRFNKWQKKWLEALESGEYVQTTGALCDGNGFCCLGVACDVLGLEAEKQPSGMWLYDGHTGCAPQSVVKNLNLIDDQGQTRDPGKTLVDMNDGGQSFAEIAAFIRANPEKVFVNGKRSTKK